MFTYQASNPYQQNSSSFSSILAWMFGSISSSSSSESIGTLILPAQGRAQQNITENDIQRIKLNFEINMKKGEVTTHDNAVLETIEISPIFHCNQRHIIKFNGNGGMYQDSIDSYIYDAKALDAKIIGFNYRGVSASKKAPKTYQDLITDGIAQVQRLLDKKIPADQILLDGHSLGGSIATMVAAHFNKQGLTVHLWNDRSLATMAKAAAGIISPKSIEPAVEASSSLALGSTDWDPDVARAYNSLPANSKGYMFVSKKSGNGTGDGVISHRASLHRSVKFFEQDKKISTGHKFYSAARSGHNTPRERLTDKAGEHTSQQVFEEFANSHLSI